MKPPALAYALLTAATPPKDYESVSGDLEEEYTRVWLRSGRSCAVRWYWSQALRSLPALLSYSRSEQGFMKNLRMVTIITLALAAMLMMNELIEDALTILFPKTCGIGTWPFFLAGWVNAACFGAIIAGFVQLHSVRIAFFSATCLILALAIPIELGFSSPLVTPVWILIFGAIPAMCFGAGVYHIKKT